MRIQYACNHPSILKLYGVSKAPDGRIVFIIEYAERTYFDLIRQGVHLSNREKFTIIRELADGLLYIHRRGFIHRDLKPSNILFDENMRPKICDFDIARREGEDSSATKTVNVGTHFYMAPEVSSGHYTHKADFYSFGCILYEMFEGSEAFRKQLRQLVDSNTCEFTNQTPLEVQNIIESCLCGNPDDRCGFLEEEDGSLLTSLSKVVREHLGLDEMELEDVENYLQETDCDDQSIASSDPGDTSEDGGLDFNDEGDIGSELGCDGSGPCEEESEHDHMEEEGEDEHLEGEGDLI